MTTGEILIHDFKINNAPSGGTASLPVEGEVIVETDIEWTFPLNFYELVRGDSMKTYRKIVTVSESVQFKRQRFRMREKWARFAV